MNPISKRVIFFGILGAALLLWGMVQLAQDREGTESRSLTGSGQPINMILSDDLKDAYPLLVKFADEHGVQLNITWENTLSGSEALHTAGQPYEIAWFATSQYVKLLESDSQSQPNVIDSHRIALSPILPAVKFSTYITWGVSPKTFTWQQLADNAMKGRFDFAMANPVLSDVGMSALLSLEEGLKQGENGQGLNDLEIEQFFRAYKLKSKNAHSLLPDYVRDEQKLDGMLAFESQILSLNAQKLTQEPLVALYPQEGVLMADYPIMLLQEAQKPIYRALVDFLLSSESQAWLVEHTHRRPVLADVFPSHLKEHRYPMVLSYPASLAQLDGVLERFFQQYSMPRHTFYVVDTSGSMYGTPYESLLEAFDSLTQKGNRNRANRYTRLGLNEEVTILPFNTMVEPLDTFETLDQKALNQSINDKLAALMPHGGTAIYDALLQAYQQGAEIQRHHPDVSVSIVLMSDGQNTFGQTFDAFKDEYRNSELQHFDIKTHAVLFGAADEMEMRLLAQLTRGRVYDGRTAGLTKMFEEIRGYQ